MGASIAIYPDCILNTTMTWAILGIAMQGMAHADNADWYILASMIMYIGISISFPLHVELFYYHCCIHNHYFQFEYMAKLCAIITHALYLSDVWSHFNLLFIEIDFDHYCVYLNVLTSIYLLSSYQTCFQPHRTDVTGLWFSQCKSWELALVR